MKHTIATFAVALVLTACGSGINGTYSDDSGMVSYQFESGGKMYTKAMGMESELRYSVDGDRVKIEVPGGGNMIMTLNKDGTLKGPMGMVLKKKT